MINAAVPLFVSAATKAKHSESVPIIGDYVNKYIQNLITTLTFLTNNPLETEAITSSPTPDSSIFAFFCTTKKRAISMLFIFLIN